MKQVFNPYLPLWEYIPDGEPHIFGDRIYIYGSHDQAGGERYCMNDYVTWSAPVDDLSKWRFEGVIYRKEQDPSNTNKNLDLWAPDVVRGPDGRYYLYYCLARNPEIGVAVSDSPAGPFEFYGHVKYPEHIRNGTVLHEYMPFDPGVLVEGDQVYLYYGFSPAQKGMVSQTITARENEEGRENTENVPVFGEGSMAAELQTDMLTLKEVPHVCIPGSRRARGTEFEGDAFYEASSVRNINGRYYYIYSSEQSHELCYAVSDMPMGNYHYGGVIISNGDIGMDERKDPVYPPGNNHGSLVQIGEDWYIFYHRHTHGTDCSRQGCAEKVFISPQGNIMQAEITSCGLNGRPLSTKGSYPAAIACHLTRNYDVTHEKSSEEGQTKKRMPMIVEGKQAENKTKGKVYIKDITDGSVIGYKYFELSRIKALDLTIRGTAEGILIVSGEPGGKNAWGSISLTEKRETWENCRIPIRTPQGKQAMYLRFEGKGSLDLLEFGFVEEDEDE